MEFLKVPPGIYKSPISRLFSPRFRSTTEIKIQIYYAEHQLLVLVKNDLSSIKEEISFPGFFIILFFATCLSSTDAGLLIFFTGDRLLNIA
jgi:hypothetical protein